MSILPHFQPLIGIFGTLHNDTMYQCKYYIYLMKCTNTCLNKIGSEVGGEKINDFTLLALAHVVSCLGSNISLANLLNYMIDICRIKGI